MPMLILTMAAVTNTRVLLETNPRTLVLPLVVPTPLRITYIPHLGKILPNALNFLLKPPQLNPLSFLTKGQMIQIRWFRLTLPWRKLQSRVPPPLQWRMARTGPCLGGNLLTIEMLRLLHKATVSAWGTGAVATIRIRGIIVPPAYN